MIKHKAVTHLLAGLVLVGCASGPVQESRFRRAWRQDQGQEQTTSAPVAASAEDQDAPATEPVKKTESKGWFDWGKKDKSWLTLGRRRKMSAEKLQQKTMQVLMAALRDDDAAQRCHALESLALLDRLGVGKEVRKSLNDSSPAVRFAAAVALGDMQYHAAQPSLKRLLRDDSVMVQLAAAYGLEKLGDDRFENWYDGVLNSDHAPLAGQACLLLGKLGNTEIRRYSREKLWRALRKKGQAPSVRLQAAEALARLGDETILPQLAVFAGSPYGDDRMIAASGLDALSGAEAYAALVVLAEDSQIEVRLAAIAALAEKAEKSDVEVARHALAYKDAEGDPLVTTRVRGLALLALGKVGDEKDAGLLYDAMAAESTYLSVAGARAAIDFVKRMKRRERVQGM